MGWECCTTHTYDTSLLDAGDNLGRREVALLDEVGREVYTLCPLVTLTLDGDHHLAQALTIWLQINRSYCTRNRSVDICRHKARSLGYLISHLYRIALLHKSRSRCSDMLRKRNSNDIGQLHHLDCLRLTPLLIV